MLVEQRHTRLVDWTDSLLTKGRNSFTLGNVKDAFQYLSDIAIKRSLNRLSAKGKIVPFLKGYYLIIAPQYAARGILPPTLFIDGLMNALGRPYYVGLLSAAAFYGAAHQQPQEFYVFTTFPVLRPSHRNGIKINYISTEGITDCPIGKRKTDSGYINISTPEFTAADLVRFETRIGGLDRVVTVLDELAETMVPDEINAVFLALIPTKALQRLGYLLERVLKREAIANRLFDEAQKAGLTFYRTALKLKAETKDYPTDEKWKVIVNTKLEID